MNSADSHGITIAPTMVRMILIDLPALVITWIFRAYFVFLAVMTILCFGAVLIAIAAALLGLPSPV